MTEQEIEQKFDEILMFIYAGQIRSGKNIFASSIRAAVNRKLDQVIKILEQNGAAALIEDIRQLQES